MTRVSTCLVCAFLVASPVLAHAEEANIEQAKMYFTAGAQAYAAGRYDTAVGAFREAYRIAPRPALLFSIAQAEKKDYFVRRQPQALRSAIENYRQYLDQVPSGGRRNDTIDALAELEPLAARLDPAAAAPNVPGKTETKIMISSLTPKAVASLDGKPPVDVPVMEDVPPGKHKGRVTAPGFFVE